MPKSTTKPVGLFIGRFQPFHNGHLSAVKFALNQVDHLYILVGSSQKSHEPRNPFTAGERIVMIRNSLVDEKIDASKYLIIPIPDAIGHAVWTAFIDQVVPKYDIVFSNDRLTIQLFKEKKVQTIEPPLYERKDYSATEVRRRIREDKDWKSLVPRAVEEIVEPIIRAGRFDGLE
ncbi:MAG: nicotinamide-nucleotide adenylyltransferase [Nitrososphaerales archaeon]